MVGVLESPLSEARCVVRVEGPLQVPFIGHLTQRVRALIARGARHVVIDLAGVSSIDAAGIGELMQAYRWLAARDGSLRIVHAVRRVRVPLQQMRVFDLLNEAARPRSPRGRGEPVLLQETTGGAAPRR